MPTVLGVLRTFLIFILVVAVATVLFTPDPGDDVQSVLHQHMWLFGIVLVCVLLQRYSAGAPPSLRLTEVSKFDPSSRLQLACVRLC